MSADLSDILSFVVRIDAIASDELGHGGSYTPEGLWVRGIIRPEDVNDLWARMQRIRYEAESGVERMKNIIIRHGENYSALLLEHEIADALDRPRNEIVVIDSDVRPGLGRVTAILGVDQKDDLVALEVGVREAQLSLPLALEDLVFVPRGGLPRTTSGKKQHARIRSMLSDGSITVSRFMATLEVRFICLPRAAYSRSRVLLL